jgi:excisionase family DNA binding protein
MLTATEAAALLSISKRTLYTLAAEKKIACYRFGSAVRFDPQDLDAYKAQCRSPATTPDAGSISLTVSSTASESALTSYFQRAGRASRRSHSTSAKRRGSSARQLVACLKAHNALAQADAACGVSPGAMGCASNGETEDE